MSSLLNTFWDSLWHTLCTGPLWAGPVLPWTCFPYPYMSVRVCAHTHLPFYSNYTERLIISKRVQLAQDFVPCQVSPLFSSSQHPTSALGSRPWDPLLWCHLPAPPRMLSRAGTLLCALRMLVFPPNPMLSQDSWYSSLLPVRPCAPQDVFSLPLCLCGGTGQTFNMYLLNESMSKWMSYSNVPACDGTSSFIASLVSTDQCLSMVFRLSAWESSGLPIKMQIPGPILHLLNQNNWGCNLGRWTLTSCLGDSHAYSLFK